LEQRGRLLRSGKISDAAVERLSQPNLPSIRRDLQSIPLRGVQVDGAGQSEAVKDERQAPFEIGTGFLRRPDWPSEGPVFPSVGVRLGAQAHQCTPWPSPGRWAGARPEGRRRRSAFLVPDLPRPLPQGRPARPCVTEIARYEQRSVYRPYGLPILQTAPARTLSVAGLVTTWLSYDWWPVGGNSGVE
jgi:hypothetical protein